MVIFTRRKGKFGGGNSEFLGVVVVVVLCCRRCFFELHGWMCASTSVCIRKPLGLKVMLLISPASKKISACFSLFPHSTTTTTTATTTSQCQRKQQQEEQLLATET